MLVKCSECGKEISSRAVFCPACGDPSIVWRIARKKQQEKPVQQETDFDSYADGYVVGKQHAYAKLAQSIREQTGMSYEKIGNILGIHYSELIAMDEYVPDSKSTFGQGFDDGVREVTDYAMKVLHMQGKSVSAIADYLKMPGSVVFKLLREKDVWPKIVD